ncbi:MFS transporter [Pararobbsia silviterrae]|uniref:MFS transporter n=1 Tax=Pararobbsia silviterrae TaxID=1792498 RepID=A0A494Y4L9_9BURK|nr:aromatic acid/H+ symport family MFS transporter [Pararobbsia silviterrae]RKP57669.1 MFS transporter [Pararobbsia silviterrae]
MTRTIDIKALIDERRISGFQWLLVVLCFLIVMTDGMDVAIMGFVTPSILKAWSISRPAFGVVISAAPLGLVLGALFAGPSSDRFGRKIVLIVSVFAFAVLTIAAAFSTTPIEMAVLRLLAGTGLGAAMPNTTTLLSEYAPQRRRALMITIMFTGFNLGSALIGLAAGYMIPRFGWRSVLMLGGAIPLALIPVLVLLLPESARFLALRGASPARIAATLGRVLGVHYEDTVSFVSSEPALGTQKPIGVLFLRGYARITLALWLTNGMGLLVIYLLTGWLPTLMGDAGVSVATAAYVTSMFQLGGTIGAVCVGWVMDRIARPGIVIGLVYLAGAGCILTLAHAGALASTIASLVFAAGFCMSGAQTGLQAFSPSCYPTVARATGVSWMLAIGRFGSIFGSAIGGVLLGMGWGFSAILSLLAAPAVCAAITIAANTRGRAQTPEPHTIAH